jgi:hypothetical protein
MAGILPGANRRAANAFQQSSTKVGHSACFAMRSRLFGRHLAAQGKGRLLGIIEVIP